MATNKDDVIHRGKALKDLHGIKDVLLAQGDPFLASIMNRAIDCIENQPAAEQVHPELQKVVRQLCEEYEKAKNNPIVHNPIGYALYQTWNKYQ
jgi:hypothetical protein